MRDYRSLWLGEWRDTIGKLRDERLAEYRKARQDLKNLREMQKSANRIRSTLEKHRANEKSCALPLVNELQILLQKYPNPDFLAKELKRIQSKIGKLESCYQKLCKQHASISTRCAKREEYMAWVQTRFANVLKEHLPIDSLQEAIVTGREGGEILHVYFGGWGHPLGIGHAHFIFRQSDGKLEYRRMPWQLYMPPQRRRTAA